METVVFKKPQVAEQLRRFVRARLHNDHRTRLDLNEKHNHIQTERFKSGSLPFYVILTPDDLVLATGSYESNPVAFAAFLRQAGDTFEAARKPAPAVLQRR